MKQAFTQCSNSLRDRNILVDLLAISFGCAAWIGVNSVYLQLPLLVGPSPEGWNLPSFLVVVIQLANLGPIIYSLVQKLYPGRIKDSSYIYILMVIGCISSILMAFLYDKTTVVFGEEHSSSMLSLAFFLALVGCTSSVLFMPYMGRFRETYMISYLMGGGIGGFVPSIVTLIQGVGGNPECVNGQPHYSPPQFGSTAFFIFTFVMYIFSTIAFILLNNLKMCKNQYVSEKQQIVSAPNSNSDIEKTDVLEDSSPIKELSKSNYYLLMIIMAVVCFMSNGVFPSVQSYSCLPYGNRAYHLTVALSTMANPFACFLAVFLPHKSVRRIVIFSCITTIIGCYALATSLLSPTPPLKNIISGEILVVLCWTFLVGLVSFIKLSIIAIFNLQGGSSLYKVGVMQQFGSALGAVTIFLILNFTTLFKSYDHCSSY
ncbi:solute carrier family 52, riboflavin transporter, member 3-A isoform X2 [Ctenocephalides felis]|nr:solute carrier family 52, riboflavin transporter, member 3-A isoform X2 [Ctenocephalides felis]XP_026474132.1 solute carrier family 52, riboflavin transporter, member 3-A isoform X2 [Ctenocephalides felis]